MKKEEKRKLIWFIVLSIIAIILIINIPNIFGILFGWSFKYIDTTPRTFNQNSTLTLTDENNNPLSNATIIIQRITGSIENYQSLPLELTYSDIEGKFYLIAKSYPRIIGSEEINFIIFKDNYFPRVIGFNKSVKEIEMIKPNKEFNYIKGNTELSYYGRILCVNSQIEIDENMRPFCDLWDQSASQ